MAGRGLDAGNVAYYSKGYTQTRRAQRGGVRLRKAGKELSVIARLVYGSLRHSPFVDHLDIPILSCSPNQIDGSDHALAPGMRVVRREHEAL